MPGILSFPSQQTEPDFKTSYVRPELLGGLSTPPWAALLQMFDPMGLSSAQLNQNAAMRGPLLQHAYQQYPETASMPLTSSIRQGTNSIPEDLNSILIKYNNWRRQNVGQELSPQERVTQGFMDVRNPNSWF